MYNHVTVWRTVYASDCVMSIMLNTSQGYHFNVFDYKSLGLPLVYMKSHSCQFVYPPKVSELEQELADCQDGLDHYQNVVS